MPFQISKFQENIITIFQIDKKVQQWRKLHLKPVYTQIDVDQMPLFACDILNTVWKQFKQLRRSFHA